MDKENQNKPSTVDDILQNTTISMVLFGIKVAIWKFM